MSWKAKPQFEHLKPQIDGMVREGLSYSEIGRRLGINHKTAKRTHDPEARKAHRVKKKLYYQNFRRKPDKPVPTEEQVTKKKFVIRCKKAISLSKCIAKSRGYEPLNATAKDLIEAFTGACHICGIAEVKLDRSLCADHCHETGKFRGWLCHRCNTGLGFLKGNLSKAITYLENKKG